MYFSLCYLHRDIHLFVSKSLPDNRKLQIILPHFCILAIALFSLVQFKFLVLLKAHLVSGKGKGSGEVVCGQVWWPILGICPLHLTHPSAHSQQWTHTRSSGQPYCGARGAVGGSVPCSRVSPQSWYWRWESTCYSLPPDNPCRTWESNLQPLGYKSNSLTIRPRLLVNYPFTLPLQKNCYHATFTVSAVYSMHIFCKHGNPGWAVIHLPKCALYNRAHCPEYCIL